MDDLIRRQAAIDALWKVLYKYEDKTEKEILLYGMSVLRVDEHGCHRFSNKCRTDKEEETISMQQV